MRIGASAQQHAHEINVGGGCSQKKRRDGDLSGEADARVPSPGGRPVHVKSDEEWRTEAPRLIEALREFGGLLTSACAREGMLGGTSWKGLKTIETESMPAIPRGIA